MIIIGAENATEHGRATCARPLFTGALVLLTLTTPDFVAARARIAEHIKRTPLVTSRQLSAITGFDARLKA